MIIRNKKEQIISRRLPVHTLHEIQKARSKNNSFAAERNPSDLDIDLLNLIFKGVTPTFFLGVKSPATTSKSVEQFLQGYQLSNNYYMPVTFKDLNKKRTSTWTDADGVIHTRTYLDTSKRNINSVRAVLVDIDRHSEEDLMSPEELDHLAEGVNYLATEEGVAPTAFINSGRGLQLIYVLEEPVYRNHPSIDKLLKAFHKALITKLDRDVLPHLEIQLKCDQAINPINQKMRCPGTLNYKSGSYAHVVTLDTNRLYNMSTFLSEELGDYETYQVDKKEKQKNKQPKQKKKGRPDTNRKNNLGIYFSRRIDDMMVAINYASYKVGTGFRNQSYFPLTWQMLRSLWNSSFRYASREDIAREIQKLDSTLKKPYFNSFGHIMSFIGSTERTMMSSKTLKLTNDSITDYCTALQIAHEDGVDLDIFFKPTERELREERREIREEEEKALLRAISNSILNNKTIKSMAEDFDKAKNTVYNKMRIIAKELNLKLYGNSVKGLFQRIRKALIKELMKAKDSTDLTPLLSEILAYLKDLWNHSLDGIPEEQLYELRLWI